MGNQSQLFTFSVGEFDIVDYISVNPRFKYLLESQSSDKNEAKNCFSFQFKYDSTNPTSDISLILTNNCNLLFYVNFFTIFTVSAELTGAIFKENIETAYYKEFADAALKKIDEYIQLGVIYAVIL